MDVKIDDIYHDLKNLVEKTHTVLVLEQNTNNHTNNHTKQKIQNTQATQTEPPASRPPAGRRGTRTDTSTINWSNSLRRRYF